MTADVERPVEAIREDDGTFVLQEPGFDTEWIECEQPAYLPGWR